LFFNRRNSDLNYCIDSSAAKTSGGLALAARVQCDGLEMAVETSAPGIQLYCGGGISQENPQWQQPGKDDAVYRRYGALCLETQNYPDAVNHAEAFGHDSILRPGESYEHTAVYTFSDAVSNVDSFKSCEERVV